jgi:hypothetical protein
MKVRHFHRTAIVHIAVSPATIMVADVKYKYSHQTAGLADALGAMWRQA